MFFVLSPFNAATGSLQNHPLTPQTTQISATASYSVRLQSFQNYADDKQVLHPGHFMWSIDTLLNCILDIKSGMAEPFLYLNQDKSPEGQRENFFFY